MTEDRQTERERETSVRPRTELAVISPRSTNTTAAVCLEYIVANEWFVTAGSVELGVTDSLSLVYTHTVSYTAVSLNCTCRMM